MTVEMIYLNVNVMTFLFRCDVLRKCLCMLVGFLKK